MTSLKIYTPIVSIAGFRNRCRKMFSYRYRKMYQTHKTIRPHLLQCFYFLRQISKKHTLQFHIYIWSHFQTPRFSLKNTPRHLDHMFNFLYSVVEMKWKTVFWVWYLSWNSYLILDHSISFSVSHFIPWLYLLFSSVFFRKFDDELHIKIGLLIPFFPIYA